MTSNVGLALFVEMASSLPLESTSGVNVIKGQVYREVL